MFVFGRVVLTKCCVKGDNFGGRLCSKNKKVMRRIRYANSRMPARRIRIANSRRLDIESFKAVE